MHDAHRSVLTHEGHPKSIVELFDLSGKSAIVTGGGQGMGLAIANRLAEAGAYVVIAHRRIADAQQAVAAIEARGGKAHAVEADLTALDDIDRVVGTTVDRYGGVDIVVNNVGGIHPFTAFTEASEELWRSTVDRNFKSSYFMSQRALKVMVAAGRGVSAVSANGTDLKL